MIHRLVSFILVAGSLMLVWPASQPRAAEWSAPLKGGGQVSVDPRTNRATVRRDGVETQLWDGVHVLQDGSTITVRSGQVVPTEAILRAREMPERPKPRALWAGKRIVGYSPCENLVHRVCGMDNACIGSPACGPARQLLGMEQKERSDSDSPDYTTPTSGQCLEADQDRAFFRTCGQ